MWEIINKTIQDPSQSQFNPNLFIHANIKMPTSSEVEHKEADNDTNMPPVNNEDTNQMNQSDKKEYNNDDQEEKPAQVQIDITEADKSDNHLVSQQDKDNDALLFVSAPKEETKNTATTLKKSARRVSYLAKKRKTQVSQEI